MHWIGMLVNAEADKKLAQVDTFLYLHLQKEAKLDFHAHLHNIVQCTMQSMVGLWHLHCITDMLFTAMEIRICLAFWKQFSFNRNLVYSELVLNSQHEIYGLISSWIQFLGWETSSASCFVAAAFENMSSLLASAVWGASRDSNLYFLVGDLHIWHFAS